MRLRMLATANKAFQGACVLQELRNSAIIASVGILWVCSPYSKGTLKKRAFASWSQSTLNRRRLEMIRLKIFRSKNRTVLVQDFSSWDGVRERRLLSKCREARMLGRVQYRYAQTIKYTHYRKSLLVACFLHRISGVIVLGGRIFGAEAQQGCTIIPLNEWILHRRGNVSTMSKALRKELRKDR